MKATVQTVSETRSLVTAARRAGRAIGLVPTMGALHAGHLRLVEQCRREGYFTVVSIYVNPTQFAPGEDFARYPRPLDADLRACRDAGVDVVFAPDHAEMYPPGDETRVRPGPLGDALCGPFRPGHFEGVCTVVAKLLNIVQPDAAYFGQKDAQQAVIIRRMVEDLRMPTRIVVCPTVREPDGLAMSSRNAYLAGEQRQRALCLYRALCAGRDRLLAGETSIGRVVAVMRAIVTAAGGDIRVDYLSVVDPETLAGVGEVRAGAALNERGIIGPRVMIAGAIRIGGTRLIDNLLVDLSDKPT